MKMTLQMGEEHPIEPLLHCTKNFVLFLGALPTVAAVLINTR